MKKEEFEELLESIRECGAYMRGEIPPSRVWIAPGVLHPDTVAFMKEQREKHLARKSAADDASDSVRPSPTVRAKRKSARGIAEKKRAVAVRG